MTKSLRVYELARELNTNSKEVIDILNTQMNIDVSNHMSTINEKVANRVRDILSGKGETMEAVVQAKETVPVTSNKETPAKKPVVEEKKPVKKLPDIEELDEFDEVTKGVKKQTKSVDADEEKQLAKLAAKKQRKSISIDHEVTVGEFAELLGITPNQLISKLIGLGLMLSINDVLDEDTLIIVGEEYRVDVEVVAPSGDEEENLLFDDEESEDDPSLLKSRWPVVTVLGHVDHGKTTLLDTMRNTRVTESEAGGITQHIGASLVEINDKKVVFLDTPGHEAFTAMRARGAQITDIAILVVAADDGLMPQTIEAINHAKAAQIPIIVAINKMDKPTANPDRVKQQLADHGLLTEDWGGDTIMVPVSALKSEGINELLEMVLLVAEMQELKANPDRPARGTIIEAKLDKGRGPVATVLVQNGTLRKGDPFVAGQAYGKVRAMLDDKGKVINEAGPARAVEVLGFSVVPDSGDVLKVTKDEKAARNIADARARVVREKQMAANKAVSLDDFYQRMQEGIIRDLNLVVKADVQGTVEAMKQALSKLENEEVRVNIIHTGVGAISESDVMLASASEAIIIGFNVRPTTGARRLSEDNDVDIRTYRIIYEAIEDVQAALKGMLSPVFEEVVLGRAEVRATFKVPGIGVAAGLYVTDGKIQRNARARVVRDGIVIYEGDISSLKRFQDDVREVASGYECGLSIAGYNDIKDGDHLEIVIEREVAR